MMFEVISSATRILRVFLVACVSLPGLEGLSSSTWLSSLGGRTLSSSLGASTGRSQVFVHLFEWSWSDVAQECEDWLGPKGFAAVQVSPPTEHIPGPQWWTRYQPVSYNLTSRSGGEAEFVSMVARCKAAGVGVYVDTVFNHMAAGSGVGIAGSPYGGRSFPLFSPEDFHHKSLNTQANCGVSDMTNASNVQLCDLMGLPDLCTECEGVQDTMAAYLSRLVEIGVAGIRVDAAKHIAHEDLSRIIGKTKDGSKLLVYSEVSKAVGVVDAVKAADYIQLGDVTEFNYGYKVGSDLAESGKLFTLEGLVTSDLLLPGNAAVVFVDNHDTQRAALNDKGVDAARLTYKSGKLYALAIAFMLAYPYGYPQVMSSFRFEDFNQGPPSESVHGSDGTLHCGEGEPWVCEHRQPGIANMVKWRQIAGDEPLSDFEALDEDTISFCRGAAACVAINRQDSDWEVSLVWPMASGVYCDVAQSDELDCPNITVGHGGRVRLKVRAQGFVALHVGARAQEHVTRPVSPHKPGVVVFPH